jgi:DNA repair exonuclease SbcCD ATPase subunit
MKIEIERIVLHNFKGQKHLDVSLVSGMNTIAGRNATGKTTVFDAFLWCLFGKDSEDRTDFNVKTLNPDGEAEHRMEHSVELSLRIDGQKTTLKRVLEEKWTKPKGRQEQVFSGHETSFYVNDVPCMLKEYNLKVETICNPITFKLLTNPLYFPTMAWAKQREILTTIAGDMSELEVPMSKALKELLARITGKTLRDYKLELANKKDLVQKELLGIQPRIAENDLKKGEIVSRGYDYVSIQAEIERKTAEISKIDSDIADVAQQVDQAGKQRLEIQRKINELRERQQRIESEVRSSANRSSDDAKAEFYRLRNLVRTKSNELSDLTEEIRGEEANLTVLNERASALRKKWYEENDKTATIDPAIASCPTCKRPFEEHDIEAKKAEITANFNNSKAQRLAEIQTEGKSIASRVTEKTRLIEDIKGKAAHLEGEITALKVQRDNAEKSIPEGVVSISPLLEANTEYQANIKEISSLEQSLSGISSPGVDEHQRRRQVIESEISGLRIHLGTQKTIADLDARIEELKAKQVELAQTLANYEKDEFTILEHTKAFIRVVEERVNSMFKIARFKMFNLLINGSEEQTCECMVSGVPFRDLNNGMKIAVGIDIINTLSDYYHIHAPIFVDNAEAINVIPESKSQMVGLYVTDDDRLTINRPEKNLLEEAGTAKRRVTTKESINA